MPVMTKDRFVRKALLAFGVLAVMTGFSGSASAARFKAVYSICQKDFCKDGNGPNSLAADASGNFYGTTDGGGKLHGGGVIFELANGKKYKVIYKFCGLKHCADGSQPGGPLVVDVQGNLYGIAYRGGANGRGAVYELSPNADRSAWTFSALYDFCSMENCTDGAGPSGGLTYTGAASGALYDGVSPLYGTAGPANVGDGGIVYRLTPSAGRTSWTETVLYSFCALAACADGSNPVASLLIDGSANMFGVTAAGGGAGQGTAFELSPSGGGGWTETVLHSFCSSAKCMDGAVPQSPLIADAQGNLYGTTLGGGILCQDPHLPYSCGVIFKIVPAGTSSVESVLHTFCETADCPDGALPLGGLLLDASGHLFGVTQYGGGNDSASIGETGGGTAFEFRGSALRVLHAFCALDNCEDGAGPRTSLLMNSSGVLFGTAWSGGVGDGHTRGGTVFTVKP